MVDRTQSGSDSFAVMYGGQTFEHTSSKVTTHVFPIDGATLKLNSYLSNTMVSVRGSSTKVPAASVDPTGRHGYWYRQSYVFQEGVILGFKLYSTIHGSVRAHSIIIVRLRADGPLINVTANLTPANKAAYTELPVFFGRGDILTPKEAKELGVKITRQMETNIMDQQEVEEDFSVYVLDAGTPKPKYKTVKLQSGEKKVIPMPQSHRRIRIRR